MFMFFKLLGAYNDYMCMSNELIYFVLFISTIYWGKPGIYKIYKQYDSKKENI